MRTYARWLSLLWQELPWKYLLFRMSNYKWHLRTCLAKRPQRLYCLLATLNSYEPIGWVACGVWQVASGRSGTQSRLKVCKATYNAKVASNLVANNAHNVPCRPAPLPTLQPCAFQQYNAKWRHECSKKKEEKKEGLRGKNWLRVGFRVKCSFSHCEVHWKVFALAAPNQNGERPHINR